MSAIFKEGFSFSGYERDLFAMNLGQGKYLDVSGVSGIDSISDGRGSVFADFDNDGDLDIFLTTAQGEAHYLFRNNVGSDNGFLRVALEGRAGGRDAFGAVVRVKTSAGVLTKLKAGGSGYVSSHDPRLLFGLGGDARAEWVEVVWPGGERQRWEEVPAGSSLRLVQGQDEGVAVAERRFRLVDPLSPEQALWARLGYRKGDRFPDLALRSLDGDPQELRALLRSGRRTLLNVWATWCVPCGREMPELARLQAALRDAGVDLVGVSIDRETAAEVPGYLAARGIDYPVFLAEEAALDALYPRGEATVPLTVLLDERGRILDVHSGWSPEAARALRRLTGVRS